MPHPSRDPKYLQKYLAASLANGHLSFLMYRERQRARLEKELQRLSHPPTGFFTPRRRSTDCIRPMQRLRQMWQAWLLGQKLRD